MGSLLPFLSSASSGSVLGEGLKSPLDVGNHLDQLEQGNSGG